MSKSLAIRLLSFVTCGLIIGVLLLSDYCRDVMLKFSLNSELFTSNHRSRDIVVALLTAPRYASQDKEITQTILSIAKEVENYQSKNHNNHTFEIFLLNHHGAAHSNLFEMFDDFKRLPNYAISDYVKGSGIVNSTDPNSDPEEVFEFYGQQTYFDQFKERVNLPKDPIIREPFISQNVPLYFTYKELFFPLKDAPVIYKQTIHASSLLRESYYHFLQQHPQESVTNNYILLLEDDFPFCNNHLEHMMNALEIAERLHPENMCALFMATGGSSILINASIVPSLVEVLRAEPTFKNGRLERTLDGKLKPMPHDVATQSCLLGELEECRIHPILGRCKSVVSDRLYFRHIGEKSSTDKFLAHKGNKWQCHWRNSLTTFPTQPQVILYHLLQ